MAGDLLTAADVARGVCRLFAQQGLVAIPEVPLPNGRRTDLTAIDARGHITIVEIKVSRADLHGDGKWPDYCDWCDRFYWALASGLDPAILDTPDYRPETSGLIVADRYGAAVVREAASCTLAPARRKAELLRIGRLAMRRSMLAADPELAAGWTEG
ncbi:DNA repair protein MmcB-related protein [Sphingopyxis sp. YF1]|uniref:MmcB family DNA repair protein n=1 Tax=Sphingopyxis sp. YF1 TaxID=2482763 RepID=UPI001F6136CE|nr:MmcB family DNA repair protein [Sphingopyxis sp. YF1]UNU44237.1 DNA repair protein MmcB-related protein [Sphingopyxis sp. YF1]